MARDWSPAHITRMQAGAWSLVRVRGMRLAPRRRAHCSRGAPMPHTRLHQVCCNLLMYEVPQSVEGFRACRGARLAMPPGRKTLLGGLMWRAWIHRPLLPTHTHAHECYTYKHVRVLHAGVEFSGEAYRGRRTLLHGNCEQHTATERCHQHECTTEDEQQPRHRCLEAGVHCLFAEKKTPGSRQPVGS